MEVQMCKPFFARASLPMFMRSFICSRSSCANTAKMPSIALPSGVSVSKFSVMDAKPTPFGVNTSSMMWSVSFCERESRSNLYTSTLSKRFFAASWSICVRPGRSIDAPEKPGSEYNLYTSHFMASQYDFSRSACSPMEYPSCACSCVETRV